MAKNVRGIMTITRPGFSERNMWHEGSFAFIPAGSEAVRVRFALRAGKADELAVEDGPLVVRAKRLSV